MTQEDKELLLKDLSARLPYKVKIECINSDNETVIEELFTIGIEEDSFDCNLIEYVSVKPFLFPMSSMTKEQKIMIRALQDMGLEYYHLIIEHYNEWHLDYRGLIEKGLAVDAKDKNVVTTDKEQGDFKEEFLYDGRYGMNGECMLFPSKDKTTWEGFQRPYINGDVVCTSMDSIAILGNRIGEHSEGFHSYCGLFNYEFDTDVVVSPERFATEEEKEKLFQAIKDNGYKWNPETKTLEKLVDMEDKGNISDGYHTFNELYEYRLLYNASMFNELAKQGLYDVHKSKKHSDGTIPFGDKNWFIVQAELPTGQISNHYEMKDWDLFNIPEKEKANPYDGHTPQDVAKRLRDFLSLEKLIEPKFKVGDRIKHKTHIRQGDVVTEIKDTHYILNDELALPFIFQDEYELVLNKFDINTLVPFESRVLVRDYENSYWRPAIFGLYIKDTRNRYYALGGICWNYCIPYEGNEHLSGKCGDCDEFYKTWK